MATFTNDMSVAQIQTNVIESSTHKGQCGSCPYVSTANNSTVSSTAPQSTENQLTQSIIQALTQMGQLQKDLLRVEKEQDKTREFYKATSNLVKISRIAIIFLLIVPIIQLVLCTAVVYYLGIQEQLSGLLTLALSGVSIMSLLEVIMNLAQIYKMDSRIDNIEKKVDKFLDKD